MDQWTIFSQCCLSTGYLFPAQLLEISGPSALVFINAPAPGQAGFPEEEQGGQGSRYGDPRGDYLAEQEAGGHEIKRSIGQDYQEPVLQPTRVNTQGVSGGLKQGVGNHEVHRSGADKFKGQASENDQGGSIGQGAADDKQRQERPIVPRGMKAHKGDDRQGKTGHQVPKGVKFGAGNQQKVEGVHRVGH